MRLIAVAEVDAPRVAGLTRHPGEDVRLRGVPLVRPPGTLDATTALVEALLRNAESGGALVARGTCIEQYGSGEAATDENPLHIGEPSHATTR